MAYYYMDDDNKVKVTEIFDVTKAESEAIFHDCSYIPRNPEKLSHLGQFDKGKSLFTLIKDRSIDTLNSIFSRQRGWE